MDTFNQVDAFGKLTCAAARVTEAGSHVPAADVVAMHAALLAFTAAVYPDRLDLVNKVLTSAYQVQPTSLNPLSVWYSAAHDMLPGHGLLCIQRHFHLKELPGAHEVSPSWDLSRKFNHTQHSYHAA